MRSILALLIGAVVGLIFGFLISVMLGKQLGVSSENLPSLMIAGATVGAIALAALVFTVENRGRLWIPNPILGSLAGFFLSFVFTAAFNPRPKNLLVFVVSGTIVGLVVGVFMRRGRTAHQRS